MNRRIVAPKREKLQAALSSLKQKEQALEEAMQQLQKLHEKLGKLQQMYDAKMKEKEELIKLASIYRGDPRPNAEGGRTRCWLAASASICINSRFSQC